jgi:hypothetical protein
MNDTTMWWVLAGALVALELATGTFYLLMLGLGAVAGALAAMAGYNISTQLVAAALVGGAGALLLGQWRQRQVTQVKHRGAAWTAVLAPGQTAAPGVYRIQAMAGNRLVLEKT